MVILSEGRMGFVEVKAPGQTPRPLQVARHRRLAELGCVVRVLDDPTEVDAVLDEIEQHTPSAPKRSADTGHAPPGSKYRAAHRQMMEEGGDTKHAGSG